MKLKFKDLSWLVVFFVVVCLFVLFAVLQRKSNCGGDIRGPSHETQGCRGKGSAPWHGGAVAAGRQAVGSQELSKL